MGQIKMKIDGVDQVIGIKCRAQVVKNRVGPPLRLINYDMYFDSGIDDFGGWLTTLKDYKIVTTAGAWSQMKRQDGSVWKFQGKDFVPNLQEDPELKQEVYDIICDKIVMTYKTDAIIDQDQLTVDNEVLGE